MLKTGIYVDAENIRLSGGYGMRYDVLVELAKLGGATLLRANVYVAEDRERTKEDREYRHKLYRYHEILRQCGFRVIKKYVKHFVDDEGILTTKANADMDLAIDALLQARNLDRIILLTGDSDFIRLIQALQNMGCRVELMAFNNVSNDLKEAADSFLSGFLVPRLLPISHTSGENWQRGTPVNFNPERGFGFMRYYTLKKEALVPETVFFHCSKSPLGNDPRFLNPSSIFEFKIVEGTDNRNRPEAVEVRSIDDIIPD